MSAEIIGSRQLPWQVASGVDHSPPSGRPDLRSRSAPDWAVPAASKLPLLAHRLPRPELSNQSDVDAVMTRGNVILKAVAVVNSQRRLIIERHAGTQARAGDE